MSAYCAIFFVVSTLMIISVCVSKLLQIYIICGMTLQMQNSSAGRANSV